MIDIKVTTKAKSSGQGSGSTSTTYVNTTVSEADHAARADKAKRAEASDQAEYATRAGTASTAVYAQKAGDLSESAEVFDKFLRKDIDDTAEGAITFEKAAEMREGLQVGSDYAITGEGVATLQGVTASKGVAAETVTASKKATVGSNFAFEADSGFAFDRDGNIVAHSMRSDDYDGGEEKGFLIATKDGETGRYKLCLDELAAWAMATVGKLHVEGDSTFDGDLKSKKFVSGFLGGTGWGIYNKPTVNAAGVLENKWTGEVDNLIVRGSMRVYEMVISQLLGENDNRIFTGMMEVDHYDAETGKVYLDTQGGKLYNPFRRDDIVMVQQYNGMPDSSNDYYVTKTYEMLITDAGCGSTEDGEDRLDWVTFSNFTTSMEGGTAETLIREKDTFVRVDNLSDSDRKGIMQIITVGTAAPYLDVIYGMKTDPDNALRGRLGNLQGITHPLFGQLTGFGEYLCNLYAVGDFVLRRTGESIDTKFQVLENMFSSRFQQTSYELGNGENYLENGQFVAQVTDADTPIIQGWDISEDDETEVWVDALGNPYMVNGSVTVSGDRKVTLETVDGRQMLRLQNCGLTQKNALIRQPGTHREYTLPSEEKDEKSGMGTTGSTYTDVQDTLYVNVKLYARTAGTLSCGFEGCTTVDGKENTLSLKETAVAYSGEWATVRMEGKWNGTGNFTLRYSGDCHVALVTVTDEPLGNLSQTVSTQILQTATNIKLLGENIDKVNGTTTQLGIDIDAKEKSIKQYVKETDEQNRTDTSTQITQTADSITQTVEQYKKDADGALKTAKSEIKQTTDSITQTVEQYKKDADGALKTAKSEIKQTTDSITTKVTAVQETADGAVSSYSTLSQTVDGIKTEVSGKCDTSTYEAGKKALDEAVNKAQQTADDAKTAAGNAEANAKSYCDTQITQTDQKITAVAGKVTLDENNNVTNISTSGLVLSSDYATLFSEQVDKNGIAHKSDFKAWTTTDDVGNIISNASIEADKINLSGHTMAFSSSEITIDSGNFKLDSSGNITATNATLSGNVTATSGKIGAFEIGSDTWGKYSISAKYYGVDGVRAANGFLLDTSGLFLTTGADFGVLGGSVRIGNDEYTDNSPSWSNGVLKVNGYNTGGNSSMSAIYSSVQGGSKAVSAIELRASGDGEAHAIKISGGDVSGYRPETKAVTGSETMTVGSYPSGTTILCHNSSTAITLTLPSNPAVGTNYRFVKNGKTISILSSSSNIRVHGTEGTVRYFDSTVVHEWVECIYIGGYWFLTCSGN